MMSRCCALLLLVVGLGEALVQPCLKRRDLGTVVVTGGLLGVGVGVGPALAATPKGPCALLRDGTEFPLVSFGFQVYGDEEAASYTKMALDAGYRNFFASVLAGNERGFAKALKESGVPRDEVYVCGSVVSNRARGFDAAYQATKRGAELSLAKLGKMEMIMLDYPGPDADSIRGQWRAFEDMAARGDVKTLAVSNFSPEQLDFVIKETEDWKPVLLPAVNQLPIGVGYKTATNKFLIAENKKRGVLVQAWSPLRVLGPDAVKACSLIGAKYEKTPQQVALKWLTTKGVSFTTQTRSKKHCAQTMDIFDFELSSGDVATLDAL